MATLTSNEAAVLDLVRKEFEHGVPATSYLVKDRAWRHHRISYDAVDRALRGLLDKGLVSKPKRGFWEPVEDRPS